MEKSTKKIPLRSVVIVVILAGAVISGAALFALSKMKVQDEKTASAVEEPPKKEFTLIAQDVQLEIAPGELVKAWTFNGTMPGPTLRFTEGDNVTVHFLNKTPLAHTVHFHGNHDQANDGVIPQILPGGNYTYNFIADPAGAFMYHCHAYPTSLHIRMGMYGSIIVDPKESPLKPAREFNLVLSEYDPQNQDNFVAKYYPVNGVIDQYMNDNALEVKQNELVRLYVINIGTTIPYSFHLHSTIFKAYQSGLPSNPPIDAQTIEIGPGNAAIVEASWNSSGTYLFHSHGMMEEKGNMGEIRVLPSNGTGLTESISMIGWQYELQKKLQHPIVTEYPNLNGSVPQMSHDNMSSDGPVVKIAKGAWDKNQKDTYQPKEITANKGESIVWINDDAVVHTVTSKQQGVFDSLIIAPGGKWQNQFDLQGEYEYYCMVHPWMEGRVHIN